MARSEFLGQVSFDLSRDYNRSYLDALLKAYWRMESVEDVAQRLGLPVEQLRLTGTVGQAWKDILIALARKGELGKLHDHVTKDDAVGGYWPVFQSIAFPSPPPVNAQKRDEVRPHGDHLIQGACAHAVALNGSSVLVGSLSGTLTLLRWGGGHPCWELELGERISCVEVAGEPARYLAGTWGGRLAVCVEAGLVYQIELRGVVSALASSGRMVAAGTWAGELILLDATQDKRVRCTFDEAVVALAVEELGRVVVVGCVDSLAGVEPDGGVRWSYPLRRVPRRILLKEGVAIVLCVDGTILQVPLDGSQAPSARPSETGRLPALSENGSVSAYLGPKGELVVCGPGDRQRRQPLDGAPRDLALVGSGETPVCLLAQSTPEILAYNIYLNKRRIELPGPARSIRTSGSGLHLSALLEDETLHLCELTPLLEWSEPPALKISLGSMDLTLDRVNAVEVTVVNQGGRRARGVSLQLGGHYVVAPQSAEVTHIDAGGLATLKLALLFRKAGDVPLDVEIEFRDEIGAKPILKKEVFFVQVKALARGGGGFHD